MHARAAQPVCMQLSVLRLAAVSVLKRVCQVDVMSGCGICCGFAFLLLSTYSCVVEAGMFAIGWLQLTSSYYLFEIIRKESDVVVIVGQSLF